MNHKIRVLLNRLDSYGFCGLALSLFSSFLSNRFQYVSLKNLQSSLKKLIVQRPKAQYWDHCFFLYISMISTTVFLAVQELVADDTCLILQDKKSLHKKITTEIESLNK